MRKRLATALLAVAMLFSTACAAPIAVNFEDTAALIDENGAEIVAPGAYDFIFALGETGPCFPAAATWRESTSTRCSTARASALRNRLTTCFPRTAT